MERGERTSSVELRQRLEIAQGMGGDELEKGEEMAVGGDDEGRRWVGEEREDGSVVRWWETRVDMSGCEWMTEQNRWTVKSSSQPGQASKDQAQQSPGARDV